MAARDQKLFPFGRRTVLSRDGGGTPSALDKVLAGLSLAAADTRDIEDGNDSVAARTGPLGLNILHNPSEPLVELIFVHGLGGGSRKSWSKSTSDDHFWPMSWLSCDPAFHNVRIYSFGYKSAKTEVVKAISGIPEYAQSLLNAMHDDPSIRHSGNAIILVGHSMGGLVIKKAFIQARAVEAYMDIGRRIQCLYFLGTPHQGSDFISTFVSYFKGIPFLRTTENITDLDPSSRLIESLNQDFPRCSRDIKLRSFWETQQSKILTTYRYVVPKHSACLNYTNEISEGLDADHRGICKFDTPTSSNFRKVRNALATSVDDLVHQHAMRHRNHPPESLRLLREYLGIQEAPEHDLADRLEACVTTDSCAWFTTRTDYQDWRNMPEIDNQRDSVLQDIILMEGEPGTGKSVLSAQVVHNLQALNRDCSYYFFDAQDHTKSSLNRLLRSLAFQMATFSSQTLSSILELQKQGILIQDEDDKYIWRKLFTNCIFQLPPIEQQFWVIDGLDECSHSRSLLQMLSKLTLGKHPKIFLTTRPDVNFRHEAAVHQNRISYLQLSSSDTKVSIKTYIEARISELRLRAEQDKHDLVDALVNIADGSFLWVKLTMDSMGKATGPQQIMSSLDRIPKGMDDLYTRILQDIEKNILAEEKPTFKAVLCWTICADPPLTANELEAAVKLDTGSEIFTDKTCEVLRNLILIDNSGKVRPIHQTVRTYLLKPNLTSPFAVSSSTTHARIAHLLINHLHQRLRNVRNPSQLKLWHQGRKGIDDYALTHFSDHLARAESDDIALFFESDRFFTSCGISWIACIALSESLGPIIRTSQNLRGWLQACHQPIDHPEDFARITARIQRWSTDLSRLSVKFGKHLLECPSAIYTNVSPFVPSESVLSVARPGPRELAVVGLNNATWDDRLCSKFYEGTCSAIASGRYNFAVGMRNGSIHIYDNDTMQLLQTLYHGAVVKLMKYDDAGTSILTAGFRKIMMWTVPKGHILWEKANNELQLAAEFMDKGVIMTISPTHKLTKHDAASGKELETILMTDYAPDEDGLGWMFRRELQYAEFSMHAEMLATMQRERPIQLSDIENRYEVGTIELELSDDGSYGTTERPLTAMTFCADTEVALLATVYRDGILAVFDHNLRLQAKRAETQGATLLAGSPSGLLLAAANVDGVITLYDFRQLTLLRTLHTHSFENIRALVFSGDGQRIIDIRDRQANVWTPAVLTSQMTTRDVNSTLESSLSPSIVDNNNTGIVDTVSNVTCVIPCPRTNLFFVGREDGSVSLHNTKDAQRVRLLSKSLGKQLVVNMLWKTNSRTLSSLSGAYNVTIQSLSADWVPTTILRHSFPSRVEQFFIDDQMDRLRLFIVTTGSIELWLSDRSEGLKQNITLIQSHILISSGLWIENFPGQLMLVDSDRVSEFSWDGVKLPNTARQLTFLSQQDQANESERHNVPEVVARFDSGSSLSPGGRLMLLLKSIPSHDTPLVFPSAAADADEPRMKHWVVDLHITHDHPSQANEVETASTSKPVLLATLLPVSHLIEHVIGTRNGDTQLLFIDKKLWVCSYDLAPTGTRSLGMPSRNSSRPSQLPQEYNRHFFVPEEWINSKNGNWYRQLICVSAGLKEECLVFAKEHEVAVIKNPFAYSEKMSIT